MNQQQQCGRILRVQCRACMRLEATYHNNTRLMCVACSNVVDSCHLQLYKVAVVLCTTTTQDECNDNNNCGEDKKQLQLDLASSVAAILHIIIIINVNVNDADMNVTDVCCGQQTHKNMCQHKCQHVNYVEQHVSLSSK